MTDQEVVIVGTDGAEHVFPSGFDPKRAADIVRQQTASAVPADAPRDARGQIITSAEEQPSALQQMLGPFAHPQTLTDFARLLTLPVDSVQKAIAGALAMRTAPSTAGQALSATGRGLEAVGTSRAARAASAAGGAEAAWHLDPKGLAVAAVPPVLRFMGRGLQRTGAALSGENVISAADEAALVKQGYSPAVIDKLRTAAPPVAAPTATAEAAPVVDEFTAARTAKHAAANTLPDQKALNEAALAARRAAYLESQQSVTPGPIVKASGQMKLTAPEFKEFQRLTMRGLPPADALAEVRTMRELAARLGGASSTDVAAEIAARIGNRSPTR